MFSRGSADEDLRHCLTVVSGYLGLALEERPGPVGPDHWAWLERAQRAAARAVALYEADVALREPDIALHEPDVALPERTSRFRPQGRAD